MTPPLIATREAYGDTLVDLGKTIPNLVVLDGETANSTYSGKFKKVYPDRYLEMYIAEQNMVSVALGLSKTGFIPFVSTFAAFLTRAFDQIRMSQYSAVGGARERQWREADFRSDRKSLAATMFPERQNLLQVNIKLVGSHAGCSIGPDGPSQMALEDLAMFRSILNSTVFYPADAVSTKKLTETMARNDGLSYLRTTRNPLPVLYSAEEKFPIGGSKVHQLKIKNSKLKVLIIAAGITVHEALKAQQQLAKDNIEAIVLDCYSVKPLDVDLIKYLIRSIENVVVVEDHYPAGGIGEAVSSEILKSKIENLKFAHLCARKIPRSGTPEELLHYEEIDAAAIINAARGL